MTDVPRAFERPRGSSAVASDEGLWFDGYILLIVGALMTLGVVMVYSASVTIQGAEIHWHNWWNSPLKQCVFAAAGFVGMLIAAHVDYRVFAWEQKGDGWRAGSLFVLAAMLLVLVFVPGIGDERMGAQRSIVVLRSPINVSFQPSEIAKVAIVIWLAAWMTRPHAQVRSFRHGFLPAIASGGVLIGLTGIEDFGTAALMGVVALCLLYVGGTKYSHLASMGILGMLAGAALIYKESYRVQRLLTFFSAAPDPGGEGYQVTQSLIAIGSGGWWGRGLGAGVQKYGYLPQDNNDFILAILCEELGVIGGILVALLFVLLLWRGWRLARTAADPFGRMLAAGITLMICMQAAFNIGVVTNSIPTKGISLPFVSAGGSGVIFLGLAAGMLASIGRNARASGGRGG